MTILIRQATQNDLPTIARLNQTVHQLHVEKQPDRYKPLQPDSPELLAVYKQRLADKTNYIFVAEIDAKPVGYCHCYLRGTLENTFVYSVRDFHINEMSVDADYQGQGVGHQLMEQALAQAQDLGVDTLSLGVAAFNQRAIDFYKQHGFEVQSYRMWRRG